MAKRRAPSWNRGAPRPTSRERSGTAGTDFLGSQSVEGTSDIPTGESTQYSRLPEPRPKWQFPISGSMLSAILAGVVILGTGVVYVTSLKTDIAVTSSELHALQKSHDTWTAVIREQIKRIEDGIDKRLGELGSMIQARPDRLPASAAGSAPKSEVAPTSPPPAPIPSAPAPRGSDAPPAAPARSAAPPRPEAARP